MKAGRTGRTYAKKEPKGAGAAATRCEGPFEILFLIPPIGLRVASFGLLLVFARAFAQSQGLPDGVPVEDQSLELVWLVAFLAGLVLFQWVGSALGCAVNVLVARVMLGWSWESIRESGIVQNWCPVPSRWPGVRPHTSGYQSNGPLFDREFDLPSQGLRILNS